MAKYILIGGGEVGRSNSPYETKQIDEKAVALTNKTKPNFLFIGLASSFSDSYYDTMKKIYSNLGCTCQYLKKKNIINNRSIVEEKIANADIIYFCGGDTIKLIDDLNNFEITPLLKEKVKDNCIFVGLSAGAIMLSKSGLSDSKMLREESTDFELINGLDFVNVSICPHYNNRKEQLKKVLKGTNKKIYGLENNTALVIDKQKIEYIKSDYTASIYMCYHKDQEFKEEKLF